MNSRVLKFTFCILLLTAITRCAGNFQGGGSLISSSKQTQPEDEETFETSFRVRFHHSDFYSILEPNQDSCAGDLKRYFKTLEMTSNHDPVPFKVNSFDTTRTLRPLWIKDVSVDLTDSNAPSESNKAIGCSFGADQKSAPASHCATFDYGAIEGIPTTLGGALLIFGGLHDQNYAGFQGTRSSVSLSCGPQVPDSQRAFSPGEPNVNVCPNQMYALAIETLPANTATNPTNALVPGLTEATEAISSWNLIASDTEASSNPRGGAGSAVAYNTDAQKILLHGGAMSLTTSSERSDLGADSAESWTYDLKTQKWRQLEIRTIIPNAIAVQPDCQSDTECFTFNPANPYGCAVANAPDCQIPHNSPPGNRNLPKGTAGLAYFGYGTLNGVALQSMTSSLSAVPNQVDPTDRIIIAGGYRGKINGQASYSTSVHRFNPTFGPEWIDLEGHPNQDSYSTTGLTTQWLDSYHTQLMSSGRTGLYRFPIGGSNTSYELVGAGFATGITSFGDGYAVTLGGFRTDSGGPSFTDPQNQASPFFMSSLSAPNITDVTLRKNILKSKSAFIRLANYSLFNFFQSIPFLGQEMNPLAWVPLTLTPAQLGHFGGGTLVRGPRLNSQHFYYLGGVNCQNYLQPNAFCPGTTQVPIWNERPRRFAFTFPQEADGSPRVDAPPGVSISEALNGTHPGKKAGISAAQGYTTGGRSTVVAWGGVGALGEAKDSKIYYLYESAPNFYEWAQYTPPPNQGPTPAADAALVFSHVTRKFYLFGGYETGDPARGVSTRNSADTWELTATEEANESGPFTFRWKKLNETGGITCYPGCGSGPSARHGHRMVEVNYNRTNPLSNYLDADCTPANPCSFAIFMEGGTTDGESLSSGRWMLDPTANGGRGHWQRVDDFPPRHLAAMTDITLPVPTENRTFRRALIFGGETAFHSPQQATPQASFVAPTLGDTYLFDYDTNQWTRVQLLGRGVHNYLSTDSRPESEKRQTYNAEDTNTDRKLLSELTPPPLSGAMMVTRKFSQATLKGTQSKPLKIPEVYLFGGRHKNGRYNSLQEIYKFCLGSTGENPVALDASCDAFDSTLNPSSPSPQGGIVGRWLRKRPPDTNAGGFVNSSQLASYLGAATYDPYHDRIILFGGLMGATASDKITQSHRILGDDPTNDQIYVYEYTPPSETLRALEEGATEPTPVGGIEAQQRRRHGYWNQVPACDVKEHPEGRFGHSLSFDLLNGQLVVTGGKKIDETPFTQEWSDSDKMIPEIWTAKRDDIKNCYRWKPIRTFGNLADSDAFPTGGLSHLASVYIPSSGFNTGYYSLFDRSCAQAGPLATDDAEVNRLLAGGAYFDVDRNELEPDENLLLTVTFLPFGENNRKPGGETFTPSEQAFFRVHLMSTGFTEESLQQVYQPRHMTFSDEERFPKVVHTLSILAQPTGRVQQEQLLLPLSISPSIDRIRIERYSGSGVLLEATLHRMRPSGHTVQNSLQK